MDLHVDKISLHLQGASRLDVRRLAQSVARELASSESSLASGAHPRLRVVVDATGASSMDELSKRIAQQILRAIAART